MRKVKFTDKEFKFYVWPAMITVPIKDTSKLDTVTDLIAQLKEDSEEVSLTDEQRNNGVVPRRELLAAEQEFIFEEGPYQFLLAALGENAKNVSAAVADEYNDVYTRVKDAEKMSPKKDTQ